jgi:VWFA-related protein
MKLRKQSSMITIILLAGLLLSSVVPALAQTTLSLSIDALSDPNFPAIETYLSVTDNQGFPVSGLAAENFALSEDGSPVAAFDLSTLNQSPVSLVFVIDVRTNMGFGGSPTHLERVIQSVNTFIDSLAPADMVGLVKISNPSAIVQELTGDKAVIKSAVSALKPEQYANVNDAIVTAVSMLRNLSGRRAIVLITDGPDSQISQYTFEQAVDEAVRQKVIVYPITWAGAKEAEFQSLAELTHGQAQFLGIDPPDQQALDAAFVPVGKAVNELRAQYKLSFRSTVPADGKEHSLVVKVDYLGSHAEQTISFTARPGNVTVTLPDLQDGQIVGGQVNLAPQVESPSDLAKIDITLDGQPLTSKSVAPFEYVWDASSVTPGEHTIAVSATDASGNMGQTSIKLVVQPPVELQITSPLANDTVSGKITVSAAVMALAQIDRVEFSVDDKAAQTINTPPYEFEWDPTGAGAGAHRITAKAVDVNGFSDAETVSFTVAMQQSSGVAWLAVIAVLAVAAILIPLGIRNRRRMQSPEALPTELPGAGVAGAAAVPGGLSSASLRELDGLTPNQVWPLAGEQVRLGRKRDENDIPIKGLSASRQHAVIYRYGNQHLIASVKPENPAYVNDQPVVQQHTLQNGDVIRIGETLLRYESF